MSSSSYSMRIIGGKWRGRKVSFAQHEEIRPTPNRIRETLFNWLQGFVHGSRCLELYAGSGILSLEALSRGAKSVTLIEQASQVHQHLQTELAKITDSSQLYQCINQPAITWASNQSDGPFDIIFLDPPFAGSELDTVLPLIEVNSLLSPDGVIYIESPAEILGETIPLQFEIYKQKKAGSVHYCLCRHRD
ncbi:MAG: 16S rRNA (guanine966-N2)-methyltransferase [Candidatus Azotimanducaceae bacterium]|jgi:16S rRNA (guanine966-N2)-methyltransferase